MSILFLITSLPYWSPWRTAYGGAGRTTTLPLSPCLYLPVCLWLQGYEPKRAVDACDLNYNCGIYFTNKNQSTLVYCRDSDYLASAMRVAKTVKLPSAQSCVFPIAADLRGSLTHFTICLGPIQMFV